MSVEGILGGDESWGGAHKVVEIFPGIYLVQKCDEEPHTLMLVIAKLNCTTQFGSTDLSLGCKRA